MGEFGEVGQSLSGGGVRIDIVSGAELAQVIVGGVVETCLEEGCTQGGLSQREEGLAGGHTGKGGPDLVADGVGHARLAEGLRKKGGAPK